MSKQSSSDPLEFVRNMWSNMGFTLPGMVTPTLDADELEQRITDMKAVEGWLRMNLNMLQASIQGLEVQAATLSTIRAMGDAVTQRPAGAAAPTGEMANPFSAAALWPWMQASSAAPAESAPEPEPEPEAQKAAPEETPAKDAAPQESDASIAGANAAEAFASAAAAASKAAMWPWQMLNAEAANQTKAAPAKKAPAKKAPAKKRTAAAKAKSGAASTAKRPARAPAKKRVPVKKA